jgi:ribosomal protein L7/L12
MPQCSACQRDLPAETAICPFCGTSSTAVRFNDQLLDQILPLLAKQQKLEAIKVIRTALNLSLADAKQAIDQLEAERFSLTGATPAAGQADDSWQTTARELLLQGKALQAIKLCKERTGCSLQSAKEQVEALASKHGLSARSGCLGMLLFIATTLVGALSVAAVYFG